MTRDGLVSLDPRDRVGVGHAARLHGQLLPASPIARLGDDFMRGFYYSRLVEDGLLRCDLFYHEGEPAGFLAYTSFPSDFMSRGLRRHPVALATTLVGAALREPRRVAVMLETIRLMRARGATRPAEPGSAEPRCGELLSFGVLPAFRSREYARRTGRRVSVALVESALAHFRARGLVAFQANVDPTNRETMFFYHALGCHFDTAPDGRTRRAVGSVEPRGVASPRNADAPAPTAVA